MATETKTFYPGAHEDASGLYGSMSNPSNPVGQGSVNTTYARIPARWSEAEAYWPFDVSIIPVDATIDSVACTAKGSVSSTSSASGSMQLYSGTVAKGSAISVNTSATAQDISPGTWTRSELASIRLRTYISTSSSSTRYFNFYGADLTVTYTYQSEKFMLKLGGAWHDIARVFKKVSGIWVEQTDLANVIPDNVRYQNGGEIESTGPALISFTIEGTSYQAEEGMTWTEWVASSYNPGLFKIYEFVGFGTYVQNTNDRTVCTTDGAPVAVDSPIQNGYGYITTT